MVSKRKSNSVVTVQRLESGALQFDVLGAGKVVFNPESAHPDNRAFAEIYGWTQRLSDRAAKPRDTETGKPATPAEKYEAIKALAEYYMTGAQGWTLSGAGGGGKSITLEAIARVQGVDYAEAQKQAEALAIKKFDGDVKATLEYLRTGSRIMKAIEAIRAERLPEPKVDADAALDEMKQG